MTIKAAVYSVQIRRKRRLMPLPEFLYVKHHTERIEIWICDQISVSLLIHKISNARWLVQEQGWKSAYLQATRRKAFDLAVNQHNSNTAEDASINGKPAPY